MKLKYYIYSLIASIALIFSACSPDDYDLGAKDVTPDDLVEGIAFTITHDSENPNIVYLESKMDSRYTVVWEHPQGRSQSSKVTLKIPFSGDYTVKFGVETRGGVVYGNPATFTINDFCADFISDELWTMLSGGVGNSKTWVLDINAEGECKNFVGPLYFYGTDDNWNTVTLGQPAPEGADSWNWQADWAGNGSWLFGSTGAMDYGSMTFDLINGANVTVEDLAAGKTYKGTYMLDVENHTMKLTDAPLLHDPGRDAIVTQWGQITILSLTNDAMQLGVIRDNDPNEGPCLLVYNFISKDFADNWVPTVDENPAPTLPEGWQDQVTQIKNQSITWKLSPDTPFDWCDLYGQRKNEYASPADYPANFTPTADASEVSLTLNSSNNKYSLALPDGTSVEGKYTLTADGIYTFDSGLAPYLIGGKQVYFNASADNTLRIMNYTLNDNGAVTDMWLGAKQVDNQGKVYQYLGYHFVAQTGGAADVPEGYKANLNYFNTDWTYTVASENVYINGDGDYTFTIEGADSNPYGIYLDVYDILADYPNVDIVIKEIKVDGNSIPFVDGDISRSKGDADTIARRYIYNPWGPAACFPDVSVFAFSSTIEVTVTVTLETGTPFPIE